MIIQNFSKLNKSKTRRDALEIINSGINSVLTGNVMKNRIKLNGNTLKIDNKIWNLSKYERIFVVGAGKAAADMAENIEKILGNRISKGIVIDTQNRKLKRIRVVKGTHPIVSQKNIDATNEIISLLEESEKNDLVICLISGGGSALLEAPRISLKELIEVNKKLLKSGANITEINTIRKHISKTKGGQLAKIVKGEIISLIISDVIGNDIEVIASGSTSRDSTTINDAIKVQKKYSLPEMPFIETEKTIPRNVTNILLVTNDIALEAMKNKAKSLGYKIKILTNQLKGEARVVGKELSLLAKKNTAVIAAGETTVTVTGKGKGGRNQELVLSASENIRNATIVSCSSDGVDFITDAAGAIADENTKIQAKKLKLNPKLYLNNNDSYNFLRKVNGIIKTGKTGTNIGDLVVVLGNKNSARNIIYN